MNYSKQNTTYQVGGSLCEEASTYVVRQADSQLYSGLKAGQFCYLLNCRQMGKSSLRVQTMRRLKKEGVACIAFEMRELCLYEVTEEEFYGGFVSYLVSEFNLDIDLENWWYGQKIIHPALRLNKFIEEILLEQITESIVIFIDEVDSVLNLVFKDDFFAFIRSCYNKRADKPKFNRLTFALLGVATPADLIEDKDRTPFNIESQAIELTGFQLDEATPLETGFVTITNNPHAVLKEILLWTGGQPFLTQWVCQLVSSLSHIENGREADSVAQIVSTRIIANWLAQDKQQHLQTIRDRILNNEQLACWSLGMYQQVLEAGELAVDDSPEIMKLRLSSLVIKQSGYLKVYNRIYQSVFDNTWVEKELQKMRPYAEAFAAWEASGRDASQLLHGDNLRNALTWASGRSLSDKDYQFLVASQELELTQVQQRTEIALLQEKQAQQNSQIAQLQAKRSKQLGLIAVVTGLALGAMPIIFTSEALAIFLNNRALEIYSAGNLQTALRVYDLALLIKPGYPEALYNQGTIYEELQDFDNAYDNYNSAKYQKFSPAYSELARLHIRNKRYSRAVGILSDGLKLPLTDPEKYAMLKNLGWAQLQLARQGKATYEQAETSLLQAIAIEDQSASPHCLLAQVLETKALKSKSLKSKSLTEWRKCLDLGDPEHPDERDWMKEAQKRVKKNVAN
ncbi:TPR repeat-containing protein [Calothrix sp. NIES-4071]|nr:TPR repeat-containing protein [Calothrix sp. NIES-4071]BAZ61974.1 TPR repeat-containing protein [Calothrix sp. NIES-4105]